MRAPGPLLLLLAFALPALADPAPLSEEELSALVPESPRAAVKETLRLAGDRAGELSEALRRAPEGRREATAFLVAYLPAADAAAALPGFKGFKAMKLRLAQNSEIVAGKTAGLTSVSFEIAAAILGSE